MGPENIWVVCCGGLAAFISNCLYSIGGTEGMGGKWIRRYLASFILAVSTNIIGVLIVNWHWQYILIWPVIIGGFSLGYGGEETVKKIIRRSIYALGILMSVLLGVWAASFSIAGCVILGLAILMSVVSIVLGVWNPFKNARVEEFLVCQVLTLFIPFLPFI